LRFKRRRQTFVDLVDAPDEKSVIEAVIKEYKITNPNDSGSSRRVS
jgi:hypothetical protein